MLKVLNSLIHKSIKLFALCLVVLTALTLTTATGAAAASQSPEITVYRDPSCSCCGGWINYLTAQGFKPKNVATSEIYNLKQQYGVPNDLVSCHTAIINGYVIEGHVPVDDIRHLVAAQPDVVGITVPGMPIGTPGMESGDVRDPFTVFSFDQQGNTKVFNEYSF